MKLCIFFPSDINYPEVDQSQPENQTENIANVSLKRQPDPNLNQETKLPLGRSKHQNQINILKRKHIYGLKIITMCICHYLNITLFSDKLLQMNPMQVSPPFFCHIWEEILEKSLETKLKHDIKEP